MFSESSFGAFFGDPLRVKFLRRFAKLLETYAECLIITEPNEFIVLMIGSNDKLE